MTLVIDASIAGQWYFGLAGSARAERLLESEDRLIAPDLLIAEFTNAAWKAVIFGGLSAAAAIAAIVDIDSELDELVPALELKDRALTIALELRHPAYDCFYLALAEQRGCQLVTADERLVRRCKGTPFAELARAL